MPAEQLAAELDEDSLFFAKSRQRLAKADDVDSRGVQAILARGSSFMVQSYCSSCSRAVMRTASAINARPWLDSSDLRPAAKRPIDAGPVGGGASVRR